MTCIQRYKDKYRVRIYIKGIQHSKVVKNKFLAKEWLKIKELEKLRVEAGVDPYPSGRRPRLTFGQFAKEYLRWCEIHKAKSTLKGERTSMAAILKAFRNKRLSDLKTLNVERYKAKRLESVAPATLNRELNCISHILKIAHELNYIPQSSLKIRRVRVIRKSRPEYFTDEEIENLLRCATGPRQKAAILLGCDAGLRDSEIRRLKWEDIDFKKGFLTVSSEPGGHTKSYKSRIIPMTSRLLESLKGLKQDDKYIFSTNGRYIRDLRMTLRRTFRDAGYKTPGIHKLRHTFGTRLAKSGIDLYRISKLMGHSDIRTTEIYAHIAPDDLREAILTLNKAQKRHSENGE